MPNADIIAYVLLLIFCNIVCSNTGIQYLSNCSRLDSSSPPSVSPPPELGLGRTPTFPSLPSRTLKIQTSLGLWISLTPLQDQTVPGASPRWACAGSGEAGEGGSDWSSHCYSRWSMLTTWRMTKWRSVGTRTSPSAMTPTSRSSSPHRNRSVRKHSGNLARLILKRSPSTTASNSATHPWWRYLSVDCWGGCWGGCLMVTITEMWGVPWQVRSPWEDGLPDLVWVWV